MARKKNRLKVSKRFLSILLAASITTGAGIGTVKLAQKIVGDKDPTRIENQIGHEDFGLITSWNLDDSDFVILDVGDHDTIETHFQEKKITYCNEHDIALGVIVSSSAEKESEIYDDVEYVKSIINQYDVNFPVYLNIDQIITNDDLNNEMKTKLIKDFLTKCSANGIYVGVHGTDTNLCRLRQYCGITEYDAFVVMDQEEVQYEGKYTVCKDLDGKITSTTNLETVINDKGLNTAEGFANDGSYFFQEGDDLTDVALQFGLSVNELLEFNNMSKVDVVAGTKLRIPSIIDTIIPTDVGQFKELETPIRGADISYAQGTNIDWDAMSENFDFLILRCCYGTDIDDCFEENAKNCSQYGIPMGAYCYNAYTNTNCESMDDFCTKQARQADFVLETLKNKKVEYPVYFDLEAPNGVDLSSLLDKEQVQEMLEIWCSKMENSGYIPGIYCNQSTFKYLQSCVDYTLADEFQVWIAGGDQYYGETKDIELEDVVPSDVLNKDYGATMAQSTDSAINSGAGNHLGHIDVNYSTVDYTDQEVVYENEIYDIKDFDRVDYELYGMLAAGGVGLTALAGGAIWAGTRKNRKVKPKRGKYQR